MESKSKYNDTFKILISTDNHLGHKEDHNIRNKDSFDSLEEILQICTENNIDILLLCGNLFHEVNPSQQCLYKCINLLQKYIYGNNIPNFKIISDYTPNFYHHNINIPIFIIHGNCDYPSTSNTQYISVLDILHASRLLNYFGKIDENNNTIIVKPLLIQKGTSKIALYGIGHIQDTKLYYMLEKEKIQFEKPPETNYFNILVIHQNRFKGNKPGLSYKNCIDPQMLPNFMNLVIWGHEHESVHEIDDNDEQNFYIYQPGSSIVINLTPAEAKPKQIGYFEIKGDEFTYKPIFLKSPRPLFVQNLELNHLIPNSKSHLNFKKNETIDEVIDEESLIENKIEDEILKLLEIYGKTKIENGTKKLPLIRLKIEYSGFDLIRVRNLEAKFLGRVANEGEILKFWRKQKILNSSKINDNEKLTSKFEESLKAKISFGALISDSSDILKSIFEDILQKDNKKAKLLIGKTFIDKLTYNNKKLTHQSLQNIINENIEFMTTKLLNNEFAILNKCTNQFFEYTEKYYKSNYRDSLGYMSELINNVKDYESHIQNITNNIYKGTKQYLADQNDVLIHQIDNNKQVNVANVRNVGYPGNPVNEINIANASNLAKDKESKLKNLNKNNNNHINKNEDIKSMNLNKDLINIDKSGKNSNFNKNNDLNNQIITKPLKTEPKYNDMDKEMKMKLNNKEYKPNSLNKDNDMNIKKINEQSNSIMAKNKLNTHCAMHQEKKNIKSCDKNQVKNEILIIKSESKNDISKINQISTKNIQKIHETMFDDGSDYDTYSDNDDDRNSDGDSDIIDEREESKKSDTKNSKIKKEPSKPLKDRAAEVDYSRRLNTIKKKEYNTVTPSKNHNNYSDDTDIDESIFDDEFSTKVNQKSKIMAQHDINKKRTGKSSNIIETDEIEIMSKNNSKKVKLNENSNGKLSNITLQISKSKPCKLQDFL